MDSSAFKLVLRPMPKDARKVPEFGVFLKERRRERSLQSLANQMRAVGVERVFSALFQYEEGRLPPVDVLRGLSFTLNIPFEKLVDRIFDELEITPVKWGEPIVIGESELPDDALAVARAYAATPSDHVKAATRVLLQVDAHDAEKKPKGGVRRNRRRAS